MGETSFILIIISLFTIIFSSRKYGWNSPITLGLACAFLYSIPAIIGIFNPIYYSLGSRGQLAAPSTASVNATILAWIVYCLLVSILPRIEAIRKEHDPTTEAQIIRACLYLAIGGYATISFVLGPTFFANVREETTLGIVTTLWRWTFMLGLLMVGLKGNRVVLFVFAAFLVFYVIAGDRTILAITIGAFIIKIFFDSDRKSSCPSLDKIVYLIMFLILLLVTKPVYLFLKNPSSESFNLFINKDSFLRAFLSFEPLITYSHIELATTERLSLPLMPFAESLLGNLLLMPNAFGVETNNFNIYMTEVMSPDITFGIAGNYLAHGYVLFGSFGIMLFAATFILALFFLQNRVNRSSSPWRFFLVILTATVAVYIHRNGLDNFMSFPRQIFIIFILVYAVTKIEFFIFGNKYKSPNKNE